MNQALSSVAAVVRESRLLTLLIAVHVTLKIALLPRVAAAPLNGDEISYNDGAMALSNALRDVLTLHPLDRVEIATSLVSNGWFMPGPSVVLTPLYLVAPTAGAPAMRAYLGLVTLAAFLAAVLYTRRKIGDAYACALLVFPGAVPVWIMFSYSAFGDLMAGLGALVMIVLGVSVARDLRSGQSPTTRQGATFGLMAISTLYLRSSALPLTAGLLVLMLLAVVLMLSGRQRRLGMVSFSAAAGVFVVALLPWSIAATKVLDSTVVTTTTLPLSRAVSFGDPDKICFAPCPPGNIWFNAVRYSRELGPRVGESEVEVQEEMAEYALRDVKIPTYATAVLANARRYLLYPADFEARFRPADSADPTELPISQRLTNWIYFPSLAILAVTLLLFVRRSFDAQVISILTKLSTGALLLQPFVHQSSGRYWPTLAPVAGLSIGLLATSLTKRARVVEEQRQGSIVLFRLQIFLGALFVAVLTSLFVLAE